MSHIRPFICLLTLTVLCSTVHAELAAQWNFDAPNDPGLDTSGNDFHLVLTGDANGLDGILCLDGDGDQAIGDNWPLLNFDDPNGAFTVSLLAKFNELPNEPVALVSKWGGAGNNSWWLGQTLAGHLLIQVSETGNASEGIELLTTESLDPNTWYFITYRVDPNNDTFDIAVDGHSMAADHVLLTTTIDDIYASTASLEVGGESTTLSGCLDEINIYSHFLSDDEIWDLKPGITAAAMGIEPNSINTTSNGNWVTGYLALPGDCNNIMVDPNSVLLQGEIPAVRSWIDPNECRLMAKFDRAELIALSETGDVELTMSAKLASGIWLQGSVIVKIFTPQPNKILVNYKAQQLVVKGGKATIGEDLKITKFGLMNQSGVDGTGSDVKIVFYLSDDSNITPEDIFLGQETIPGLQPHTKFTGSTTVTIPGDLTPGEYYLGSYVDPDNLIEESKESDNSHVRDDPLTVD